ncbi:transglutaminase-like domain-containing protein [Streptomyces sp. NP-1717]|uniref:transglutaminase family protein n=1 Tax=Streptomyces sp. NP-1717 TaxID=2704470 RepID=UPI001F5E09C9|nr:transglutaminase-like domain-containing protein [Streptomyces sp. NP-1717]MCI3222241.1 tetratricopeptide repeat protein [Streptomyces sp. NP-1717]
MEPEPSSTARRSLFAAEARAERPDVALLCLLIGTEADAALDEAGLDAAQIELDRLAGMLPFGLEGPRAWATALADLLGTRLGFRGSPGEYRRLEASLLHEVLRRRRGLPILLSVLWTEVARRAGAPVYGVALPGHFVVGLGVPEEPDQQVLVDPYAGGRLLTRQDTETLVTGATGAPLEPSMLSPAEPLHVVVRILNNIRAWASTRPERGDVALWGVELSLLLPSHPARLRYERAQLLVRRGEFLAGATEMEEYAEVVAAVEPSTADMIRHKARAARAMLN